MLAIRLPDEIEKRLASLAVKTGRTKSFMSGKPLWNTWKILRITTLRSIELRILPKESGR